MSSKEDCTNTRGSNVLSCPVCCASKQNMGVHLSTCTEMLLGTSVWNEDMSSQRLDSQLKFWSLQLDSMPAPPFHIPKHGLLGLQFSQIKTGYLAFLVIITLRCQLSFKKLCTHVFSSKFFKHGFHFSAVSLVSVFYSTLSLCFYVFQSHTHTLALNLCYIQCLTHSQVTMAEVWLDWGCKWFIVNVFQVVPFSELHCLLNEKQEWRFHRWTS